MDGNGANIVWVCFKLKDLFRGVVVKNSNLIVIRADNNPVFTSNEATRTNRKIANLNRSNYRLKLMVNKQRKNKMLKMKEESKHTCVS